MKIGLIGYGNIGTFLLERLNVQREWPNAHIVALLTGRKEVEHELMSTYGVTVCHSVEQLMEQSVDVVVETSTIETLQRHAPYVLQCGVPLIVSSIGAFADATFAHHIRTLSEKHRATVYIPAGAIGGLDALQAAAVRGEVDHVSLTTRKPPNALNGKEATEVETLFKGSAKEAIALYPRNMNVAVALSLAGIGVERTQVTLLLDPNVTKNEHTIEVEGAFGSLKMNIQNNPMPTNPKTSYLAALSIYATIRQLHTTVKIG